MQANTVDNDASHVSPVSKHAYDAAIQSDLKFLLDWEEGLFTDLYCYLRVRQIRNGNPILVAERLLRKVDVRKTRPSM